MKVLEYKVTSSPAAMSYIQDIPRASIGRLLPAFAGVVADENAEQTCYSGFLG